MSRGQSPQSRAAWLGGISRLNHVSVRGDSQARTDDPDGRRSRLPPGGLAVGPPLPGWLFLDGFAETDGGELRRPGLALVSIPDLACHLGQDAGFYLTRRQGHDGGDETAMPSYKGG